jgi:hypothetical protein
MGLYPLTMGQSCGKTWDEEQETQPTCFIAAAKLGMKNKKHNRQASFIKDETRYQAY